MYIIELIIKKLRKNKEKIPEFNPLEESTDISEEVCEHIFMPIDSTGEMLSCTKCGVLRKRSELKNINFFEN